MRTPFFHSLAPTRATHRPSHQRTVRWATVAALVLPAGLLPGASAQASSADFAVSMTGPAQVEVGQRFLYDIVVTHDGKGKASTTLTDRLPAQLTATGASSTHGACSVTPREVVCEVANLPGSRQASITIAAAFTEAATVTNAVTLTTDGNAGNNSAAVTTTGYVLPPEPVTLTPPYHRATSGGLGTADATSGALGVDIPSTCVQNGGAPGRCDGFGRVDHSLMLDGGGPRQFAVDVELYVRKATVTGAEPTAGVLASVILHFGSDFTLCETQVVGATAASLSISDQTLRLRCAWPTTVPSGNPASVGVLMQGYRNVIGSGVELDADVRSITVTG